MALFGERTNQGASSRNRVFFAKESRREIVSGIHFFIAEFGGSPVRRDLDTIGLSFSDFSFYRVCNRFGGGDAPLTAATYGR